MRLHHVLFFVLALICSISSAVAAGRTVNLEWEEDPDAVTYEIEVGVRGSKVPFTIVRDLRSPRWVGQLRAGKFWMRVRGLDDRSIPGDWSEMIQFQVFLDAPEAKSPSGDVIVKAISDLSPVEFRWKGVDGAEEYSIVILDDSEKPVVTRKVKGTEIALQLPWAMKYTWFVQAVDENGDLGMKPQEPAVFTLGAPAPPAPSLIMPSSSYVRTLGFRRPAEAETVRVHVQRFDSSNRSWISIDEKQLKNGTEIDFKAEWPGGRYLISATSEAKYHATSPAAELSFDVIDGDRSQTAENRAFIRRAIDRTQDWFVITSYVVSQVTYSAKVAEENRAASMSSITGTGLIGVGKFWPGLFGVYGGLDYGGIVVNGVSHQFLGGEGAGLLRWAPHKAMDIRLKTGFFARQFPQILSTSDVSVGNLFAAGIVVGGEYWYSLSPKFAVQSAMTARYPFLGSSAGGTDLVPALSYQAGIMGGLRLTGNTTGLLGYSYRMDRYRYAGRNDDLGITDAIGESSMRGHYLQMILEYGF
jgi:hypothetical protein